MVSVREAENTPEVCGLLIALSEQWEQEGSCRGYRRNTEEDLSGRRIFLAYDGDRTVGYLFGIMEKAARSSSVMPEDTPYFELEELYVIPDRRSQGVGKQLFRFAEASLSGGTEWLMLSTASKNWKAVLHFYIDELGMEFWDARLFKKIPPAAPCK